ncbi:hypothetical protein B0T17DRAFT_609965 [Bombardia bombarda]|uniref:Phosphatidate phosphatase APP1 catalytic domain-containing protein n=1 Tax=Bombardia bombarda TaxID=252184 RepID=A0AA39WIP7_9PEZI|nr:hypothetical protein B0T17DRAFT_609965 [Bombardia bombarda]
MAQTRTRAMAATAQSTSLERQTRSSGNFHDTERKLSDFSSHKSPEQSRLANLLSYLGSNNPLPVPISRHDAVWLFDNVAFRGADGSWQAEFVTAVFGGKPSAKLVDVVGDVASALGLDVLPGRQVKLRFGEATQLKLGPGGRDGISSDIKKLTNAAADGAVVTSTADVPAETGGVLRMKTQFAEPEGWAIISDMDDTIKITQTSSPTGILRSTFVSEPTPVAGMPELYAYMQRLITPASPFFYLSASPYNLYPFLHDFTEKYYPHGQLILRDASWMTIPGLLSNLTLGTQKYKVDRMRKVNSWLPRRKMIVIGDSTQSDPEAYGEIYRAFPGWIKLILIRKVTDTDAVGSEDKNNPSRFELAFKGIPRDAWHVFEDPAECRELVQKTVGAS